MDCNADTLCKTSMMLMTTLKNPTLLQKVLEDWLRLPERQELFEGREGGLGGPKTIT